jgi:hypothetical protein
VGATIENLLQSRPKLNRLAPGNSSREQVFNIRHDRQLNDGAGFYKQLIEGAGFLINPF